VGLVYDRHATLRLVVGDVDADVVSTHEIPLVKRVLEIKKPIFTDLHNDSGSDHLTILLPMPNPRPRRVVPVVANSSSSIREDYRHF